MIPKTRRARIIQQQIAEVLSRHWDPLDATDAPEGQEEYDAYVGGV
jgi:hypothetical protein